MHIIDAHLSLEYQGENPYILSIASLSRGIAGKHIMTAITSGTYGHQPIFSGAIRQLAAALFSSRPVAKKLVADATIQSSRIANTFRVRIREANDVRELARSVEQHSPGFAADLYAAASRHEGYDD
jgi:hypothetical protein